MELTSKWKLSVLLQNLRAVVRTGTFLDVLSKTTIETVCITPEPGPVITDSLGQVHFLSIFLSTENSSKHSVTVTVTTIPKPHSCSHR